MLTILATSDSTATGSSGLLTLLIYAVAIGGLFYFLMIRPQRTRMRRHQELMSALRVGDEVTTIGGIYGTIEFMDEASAVLLTEGGGRLRVARRALAERVAPEAE